MSKTFEALNRLRISLLAPGEEAGLSSELDVDSEPFLLRNTCRPAEQLAQIVSVRNDINLVILVFVVVEVIDCCKYGRQRRYRPAHAMSVLIYEDHARVGGNALGVCVRPDFW